MAKRSLKFLCERKAECVGTSEMVAAQHMLWDSSVESTECGSTPDAVIAVTYKWQ